LEVKGPALTHFNKDVLEDASAEASGDQEWGNPSRLKKVELGRSWRRGGLKP